MIVLSSEKELITVKHWEEIVTRPGFTGALDPTAHKLEAIIGRYQFPDKIPCGLSNCQTPHYRGYIVATTDKRETNIGKDCGKSYFGVDFETLSAKFDRDITEKENREKVWSFVSIQMPMVAERVRDLRFADRGGDWVYKTSRPLVEAGRGVHGAVVRRVTGLLKTGGSILYSEREATDKEVAELERQARRTLPRPQVVQEPLAEVRGLDALASEHDLKGLLVLELEERIKELGRVDIDSLGFEELRKWAKWIGTVDQTLDKAVASIEKGRLLLTAPNLRPFADAVGLNTEQLKTFQKFLDQLPAG